MDPLTAAGTFATIVGLLSNFKAGLGQINSNDDNTHDFPSYWC